MGSKPWLKVGVLVFGGLLLCGCQDQQRRDNGLNKVPPMPPPNFPNPANGPGTGAGPKLPVVVLTGDTGKDLETRAKTAGAAGFLTKPCQPDKLIRALEKATLK